MLFLTSLIYILLFFLLPGQVLLVWAAPRVPIQSETLSLILLNVLAYDLIWLVLRASRYAYHEFDGVRNPALRELKSWLHIEGSRGFVVCSLILLGSGAAWLAVQGLLPMPCWFLYGAIALGSLDGFGPGHQVNMLTPQLPETFLATTGEAGATEVDVIEREFEWTCPAADRRDGQILFRETFRVATEPEIAGPAEGRISSLEEYGILAGRATTRSIREIAAWFRKESLQRGFSSLQEIVCVVSFSRSVLERGDIGGGKDANPDAIRLPHHLLLDGGGSREEGAVLAATILRQLGHRVGLFYHHIPGGGHLGIAIPCDLPSVVSCEGDDGRIFTLLNVASQGSRHGHSIPSQILDGVECHRVIEVP